MSAEIRQLAGQFSEMGWSETEPHSGLRAVLLMCVTGAYFGSLWLSSGLAPVAFAVSQVARKAGQQPR